ncbi:MAG: ABC transporter substrate-binding protein [Natronospirillum sp.]|uniref:ABC transporter substrate-binding protein n=1 Tax=Natronospirillum sp. TaxID=2812955 RepID=UPI0025E4D8CB|nr:ABC transporter substrate-binding protein [Natronospirillum sp.]MCH8552158.1 ABC transporter substrate-binding protein [Natronospirillum sp.]
MLQTRIPALAAVTFTLASITGQVMGDTRSWDEIVTEARGEQVFFNAWGGSDVINDYLIWAADELSERYDIDLEHVKVGDTGDVVSRVLAERAAGRESGGSVDLVWINGENFRAMKDEGLLLDPWTDQLPNFELLDFDNKPTLTMDFSTPVDNMEAPWGMAQLTFMYDSARVDTPPDSMAELLAFAQDNPGRVTYPALPSFYGTTFLKQAMLELADDPDVFYQPADETDTDTALEPLWTFLDDLHALAWQQGRSFPQDAPQMKQMLNDGEIMLSLSFNPNDASNAILTGELPDTVRTYVHSSGTLGNTHFVAIPFNAQAPEAAMVVANFLMSPEAQARKADIEIWGDPTVLSMEKLSTEDQQRFADIERGPAGLNDEDLEAVLLEPHASWVPMLEDEWQRRYAR